MEPTIRKLAPAEDVEPVRLLFREYAAALDFDLCFQNFERELAGLPGAYAPPGGCLLLATMGDDLAGCVALRRQGDGVGEMKRLYVRDRYRGTGLGRALAERVLREARALGYQAVRLDTVAARMPVAVGLYRALGFREIPAYDCHPVPGTIFMELRLPVIAGRAAALRLATLDDAEQVQAIYAPYCDTLISFEIQPPTVEEMRDRLIKVLGPHVWLVCVEGDTILGYAYATKHRERAAYRWSVDTAVYVRAHGHRRGIGRALYTSLLALLPLQGYVNAYAGVALPNPASVGLHTAVGFEPVGVYRQVGFKCGAWHDVAWFQRLLQPRTTEPPPLRDLEDVRHTAEWAAALEAGQRFLRGPG